MRDTILGLVLLVLAAPAAAGEMFCQKCSTQP
jgi:hypothetical protein